MRRQSGSRKMYEALLWLAVAILIVTWMQFAWEGATGLTFATRNTLGHGSTPDHFARTRRNAIFSALVVGPVAVWCFLVLREKE